MWGTAQLTDPHPVAAVIRGSASNSAASSHREVPPEKRSEDRWMGPQSKEGNAPGATSFPLNEVPKLRRSDVRLRGESVVQSSDGREHESYADRPEHEASNKAGPAQGPGEPAEVKVHDIAGERGGAARADGHGERAQCEEDGGGRTGRDRERLDVESQGVLLKSSEGAMSPNTGRAKSGAASPSAFEQKCATGR